MSASRSVPAVPSGVLKALESGAGGTRVAEFYFKPLRISRLPGIMPAAFLEANPLQMHIFGTQSLPTSPVSAGSDWGTPPDPGPAAREEEQEWMRSRIGSQESWPTR